MLPHAVCFCPLVNVCSTVRTGARPAFTPNCVPKSSLLAKPVRNVLLLTSAFMNATDAASLVPKSELEESAFMNATDDASLVPKSELEESAFMNATEAASLVPKSELEESMSCKPLLSPIAIPKSDDIPSTCPIQYTFTGFAKSTRYVSP